MALTIAVNWYFILSVALFGVGLYGVLSQKTGIRLLMAIEMMLNAANINFVAFGSAYGANGVNGYVYAFFVIAIAAAEAAVGLAIFVNLYRVRQTIELDQVTSLKG